MNAIKRISIAIIFIPLLLWAFWMGNWQLRIVLSIIVAIQGWELQKLFLKKNIELPFFVVLINVFVFLFAGYGSLLQVILVYFILFISVLGRDLLCNRINNAVERVSSAIFLISYSGLLLASAARINAFTNGNKLLISLLILIWITDTFAYFIGMTLGRHRNIFPVSPKKSLEGFLAGVIFAMIFSYLFYKFHFLSLFQAIGAGISAGLAGQLGDLFESILKRDFGVKDSSNIIPGHGGMLDRFDSFLIAAPTFLLFLQWQ